MLRKSVTYQHKKSQDNANQRQVSRRSFWLGLLMVIVSASMVAGLILPKAGQAQFGAFVQMPVVDTSSWIQRAVRNVVDAARYISDKADKLIDKVSKKVGDVAFRNALKVFLGKIAEDTATWVASAGTGQKPLFVTDPNYFKDLGSAAAGDYLDSLSKDKFGVSLCDPGAFKVTLDIALRVNLNPNFCKEACQANYQDGQNTQEITVGDAATNITDSLPAARASVAVLLAHVAKGETTTMGAKCAGAWTVQVCLDFYNEAIARAEEKLVSELKQCNSMCAANKRRLASCTLTQISDNAKQGLLSSGLTINGQSTNITGAALQEAYKTGDLPKIFRPDQNPLGMFLTQLNETQAADVAKKQQEKDLLTFNSIFPLRSIISGKIKTPGALTTSSSQEGLSTKQSSTAQTTQTGSPVADAFGIFTNTLTSKLIERIFKGGIVDDKGNSKSLTSADGSISRSSSGVQAARDRFASLSQVSFGTGGGIDILNDLSACPVDVSTVTETSLGIVQPNNCVLDPSFRQAIEEHLTVKEALARGLLSDHKSFGFDANGREPDFRNGYPYRSLVILRKYRIIPVGWELAAQHIRDYEKQNVALSTIVNQFNDPTSAYYRLVDPSWVLKAPENICLRTGFTEAIVSDEFVDADGDEGGRKNIDYQKRYCTSDSDANVGQVCDCDSSIPDDGVTPCISSYDPAVTPISKTKCTEQGASNPKSACAYITPRERQVQRREACVDEQTCILENDDGTCKQYGTCVEEKDAWRFNGQSCNELYASCATYTEPAGTQVSYLQNTLQKSVCGPDNAGCQQYCSKYDYTTNAWTCTVAASQTKRFDRDLQSCDPSVEGCTQFIRQTTGTNLVGNASFELGTVANAAGNVNFEGWRAGNGTQTCGAQTFASTDVVGGSQSARLQWAADCGGGDAAHYLTTSFDTGTPLDNRTFTVSFYAKSEGASCDVNTEIAGGLQYGPSGNPTVTPDWQRFSYSYTYKPEDLTAVPVVPNPGSAITLFFRPTTACTYLLDNVQVEEGSTLTDYKDYGVVNLAHLKRPPAEVGNNLGCTGNTATDPAACSKFIAKCGADDVGCDLYTPVAGGINVPAKPGQSCPADKVGCASFREQPTIGALDAHDTRTGKYCANHMATEMRSCTDDSDCENVVGSCTPLVSFIGTTGKQCTAQDVGCEAFTNLDEVAKGGEGKAQFTKLQLCVPPSYTSTLENYYSWVGNEESGYQLKKYLLVPSNLGAVAPCTNLTHDTLVCNDTLATVASCTAAELGINPDCSQYYDDGGNITYRLRSRVIEQTENCHPYRNEVDSLTYYADSTRSLSCSADAIGCREYVGNTGSNTRTLISSDFENGSYSPWTLGAGSDLTTESVSFGGHSLRVGDTSNNNASATVDTKDLIQSGKTYVVKFWARSYNQNPNPLQVQINGAAPYVAALGVAPLTLEWNEYTLGSAMFTSPSIDPSSLSFRGLGGSFYLDNVTFTELTDSAYKIKSSQTVCGGLEGCSAYRNQAGAVVNLMSFAKLCQADKVGCEALINTRNSSTPFSQTITLPNLRGDVDGSGKVDQADVDALSAYLGTGGAPPFPLAAGDIDADGDVDLTDLSRLTSYVRGTGGTIASATYPGDTVTTPADVVEYWVNDSKKACNAEDKGCRALGRQQVNLSGTTYLPILINTETVYVKDNPDVYSSTLCGLEALSCEEYGTSDGGNAYFRNPSGRSCEYRDATGSSSAGWYLQGTNNQCPIRNQGNIPPAVPTGGFAGLCPAEQNGCGTFLDPLGTGESLSANSGMEIANPAADPTPQNWIPAILGGSLQEYGTRNGSRAVRLSLASTGYFSQTISLDANTYYVVSADVERNDNLAITAPVRIGLIGCRDALGAQVSLHSPDNSMIADNSGAYQEVAADRFLNTAFQRISGRVYSGNAVTCQVFAGTTGTGSGHWFDNLQVNVTTNTPVLRQSVDSTSCNGQVGDKLGCHLFNDTSNTGLSYDVDQSPLGAKPTDADATGGVATCADKPELCDSNIILKVSRDRTCSQWLSPTTTIESTKPTGQKENLVLGVATCDRFSPSGQCNRFVDEKRCSNKPKQTCIDDTDCGGSGVCKPMPLTGNTQAYSREDLRNRSGLVVAGLQFSDDQIIKGKYPFGIAPQVGGDGLTVSDDILNGNFSSGATLPASGWTLASAGLPDGGNAGTNADGSTAKLMKFDTQRIATGISTVEVDPYVSVTPSTAGSSATTLRTASATLANKLSSRRTYMLSFNARYLQEPSQDVLEPLLSAGISSADNISATNAWYGKVRLTTEWQRFVVGPLKLSDGNCLDGDCSTAAQGNSQGTLHVGFKSDTGFVFIAADSTNRTPFAIDSVSLLPTLQVDDPIAPSPSIIGQQSGQAFVARSCRAYPNSSAKTCSYTDDTGKQFNGWNGYCLEKDPQNPNSCLSWLPLDLLSGDRNIFGKLNAAGYSGKSPLYMCLNATGNYNLPLTNGKTTFDNTLVQSTACSSATPISPLLNQSFAHRRPMVTKLRGTWSSSSNRLCGNSDDLCDSNNWSGFCANSTADTNIQSCLTDGCVSDYANVVDDDKFMKSEIEKVAVIFQSGETTEWWPSSDGADVCYASDISSIATGCNSAATSRPYKGKTPDGDAYMILDANAEGKENAADNRWSASWLGVDTGGRRNVITFSLIFESDALDAEVQRIGVYAQDSSQGGAVAFSVIFYLRNQCTQIVKVVGSNGLNSAWANNTASTSYGLPNYAIKQSQDSLPYGSIAPPEENFDYPTLWDSNLGLEGYQPLDVKQDTSSARAGSAFTYSIGQYSCNSILNPGGCSGRMCMGLPVSALSNPAASYSCDNVVDEAVCQGLGGYCGGYGPAKICVSGSKAPVNNVYAPCSNDSDCGSGGKCDYGISKAYCSTVSSSSTKKVGDECLVNADCGPGTCTRVQNYTGGYYSRNRTNDQAIARLKLLFANAYEAWTWQDSTNGYVSTPLLINSWQTAYNNMLECGDRSGAYIPTVSNGTVFDPSDADINLAYCGKLPEVANITIGKTTSDNVFINSGELIQLNFNTSVDKEQLPLKSIAIDWNGDYSSDQIVDWGFAPLSSTTDPHSISHVYRYGDGSGSCFKAGTGPYATNSNVGGHEYCVARPGVQVQDNWEWCNGGRCRAGTLTAFPVGNLNYWEQFGGNIIVIRR